MKNLKNIGMALIIMILVMVCSVGCKKKSPAEEADAPAVKAEPATPAADAPAKDAPAPKAE